MKRNVLLTLALLSISTSLPAQKYVTALGVRVGTDWGVTLQQRIAKHLTIEGIAQSSFQRDEIMLTGLLETHMPFLGRRFNLYLGAGVHKGWLSQDRLGESTLPNKYEDPFGATFLGGLELSLGRLNLSYDFKPAINIRGGTRNFYSQSGLSLRYVLINEKDVKKRQRRKRREQRRKARPEGTFWDRLL